MIRPAALALLLAACAGTPAPARLPDPEPVVLPPVVEGTVLVAPVRPLDRHDAALAAYRAGLMPLHATGVSRYAELAPERDGRGVLIAILDSGIDPAVDGLQSTSEGRPKLIDLRDFSGEGRVELQPVVPDGDVITVGRFRMSGASVVRGRLGGTLWGGLVSEARFGTAPAADLNGSGSATDTLVVIVGRGNHGWALFVDAHGDGSLADDQPIHDFAVAQEWFGWSRADAPPIGIAVNLADSSGTPLLDLVFDNSGHGTHVAGIAAGHSLYGVRGFDGVAPGARLLGLKIANNARGGITTSGSMQRALAHAIAVAADRRMPLVVNLSFGVGNQHEGTADIDHLIDSTLRANRGVVMVVSASNDGPGLSTLGFPASASEVLSVGATSPLVFDGLPADPMRSDPVAFFSSRGGERHGPDLVAPGVAWSSVPRYDAGSEEKSGTSMAAPHVAGLAARLLNVRTSDGRLPTRAMIEQALTASARPIPDATVLDQGAGLPEIGAAARWIAAHSTVPRLHAVDLANQRLDAIWLPSGVPAEAPRVRVERIDRDVAMQIRLRSSAAWLDVAGPAVRSLPPEGATLELKLDSDLLMQPGTHVATLFVDDAQDEGLGVLLRIPVTVQVPIATDGTNAGLATIHPGAAARATFLADTGLGLQVRVETASRDGVVLAALHEPGGQPFRDVPILPAGNGERAGVIEVDARDVRSGSYEVVMLAPPRVGVAARVAVRASPLRLGGMVQRDSLVINALNVSADTVAARLRVAFSGAERQLLMQAPTARITDTLVGIPEWAGHLVLDVAMAEDDWSRFTDFGVTLWHRDGRILATEPLNYAFGRMRLDIPPALRGDTLSLELAPADAVPGRDTPWQVEVAIRFLAERPVVLDGGGTEVNSLPPGAITRAAYPLMKWPLPLGADLAPLVTVVALQGDTAPWTREIVLTHREGGH